VHVWHSNGHRKSGITLEQLTVMAQQTMIVNQITAEVSEAVDLARQPDDWQPKPWKSRKEYHKAYYWRHADKRRKQRLSSKTLRRQLEPLIRELCIAVDLGRISANW
jgi:hypothetical protein